MSLFTAKYLARARQKPDVDRLIEEAETMQREAQARAGQPDNPQVVKRYEARLKAIKATISQRCTPYELMALNQHLVWMIPIPQTPDR